MDKQSLVLAFQEISIQLAGIHQQLVAIAGKKDLTWIPWLVNGLWVFAATWIGYLLYRLTEGTERQRALLEETVRISQETLQQQIKQSQMDLWRSLCGQWQKEMLLDRKFFATYWQDPRMLKVRYAKVMNFFETVAYLIRQQAIDEDLTKRTFWSYFSAYFSASYALLQEDRKVDPLLFQNVYDLKEKWGLLPTITKEQGISAFMSEESALAK